MSALASARRSWRERTSRAIAREQCRCSMCHKKEKNGLIDGKCNVCFDLVQQRQQQLSRLAA